jgi:hypothetical protein
MLKIHVGLSDIWNYKSQLFNVDYENSELCTEELNNVLQIV